MAINFQSTTLSPYDQMLLDDATALITDESAPTEPITVTDTDSGKQYQIFAVVNRVAPTAVPQTANRGGSPLYAPSVSVVIMRDAAGKIGLPQAPQKNWKVKFPSRIGDTATDHLVVELTSEDVGGFHIQVR